MAFSRLAELYSAGDLLPLAALDALLNAWSSEPSQTITTSGTVVVTATDSVIVINKTVASATAYTLPTLASRNYRPLLVIDYAGTGGDHGFTPSGSEKIQTRSSWTLVAQGAGYPCVIRLLPFTGIGWGVQ